MLVKPISKQTIGHFMMSFDEFRRDFKPLIRNDGLIDRVTLSLRLDQQFKQEFALARRHLASRIESWPDQFMLNLMQFQQMSWEFEADDMDRLRQLFVQHGRCILAGRFEEDFFSSLEDIALFFIYHKVWPLWVAGALKAVIMGAISEVYDEKDTRGRRSMTMSLTTLLVLELHQIQRVYVAYNQCLAKDPALQSVGPVGSALMGSPEGAREGASV